MKHAEPQGLGVVVLVVVVDVVVVVLVVVVLVVVVVVVVPSQPAQVTWHSSVGSSVGGLQRHGLQRFSIISQDSPSARHLQRSHGG